MVYAYRHSLSSWIICLLYNLVHSLRKIPSQKPHNYINSPRYCLLEYNDFANYPAELLCTFSPKSQIGACRTIWWRLSVMHCSRKCLDGLLSSHPKVLHGSATSWVLQLIMIDRGFSVNKSRNQSWHSRIHIALAV